MVKLNVKSEMIVTIYYHAESRYTPNGKRLASFYAAVPGKQEALVRMNFQQWENEDRVEIPAPIGSIDALLDLPPWSEIIVEGYSKVYEFKGVDGVRRRTNLFTVSTWRMAD